MFLVYINDLTEGVNRYINIFANDAKLLRMSRMRQREKYSMENYWINKTNVEKDLGLWITDNLSPDKHINKIIEDT